MNRINPKRLGRAGSLDTPSIMRRKPSLAQDIMRRNRRNAAPTRNRWSGAVWTANGVIKTIFAVIGAIVVFVVGVVFFGGF